MEPLRIAYKTMNIKSIAAQVAEAIARDDAAPLRQLISEDRSQINTHTFMSGQTWLGYAAQKGSLKSVIALIDIGFDKNLGTKMDGYAPICSAAHHGHVDVVKFFLDINAVLDVSSSVRNPLFSAIVGKSREIVGLLLEAGIDSNVSYTSDTMIDMDAVAFALMRGELDCARDIAVWNTGGDEVVASEVLSKSDEVAERNVRSK